MNSGNALIKHLSEKGDFCVSRFPGSAETQVNWSGTVKGLLIAYFISNISAKKYQNAFMYVKVVVNQRWDVFKTQCRNAWQSPAVARQALPTVTVSNP